ncbi:DUF5947 family protein [Tunturibacter empetritectus]|uniref:Uncharacterized protein n=1 Tax=Tunturiibacter lichenicola TaxID=2051959 RepID=A0A7W8J6W2_9BACT|nr:DUF5947 family protein [Edaphobacter lichenicola]MBB5342389.1 hypothetical protein [Edaphobacter lichenicola]
MNEETLPPFEQAFGALRQFTRARRSASRPLEQCELCSAGLAQDHPHLVELSSRQILCACDACALLFDGREKSKFKRVSRRAQHLIDFEMTDGQWESLLIPINMAFFFSSSLEGRVIALYPSPAGAVESLLPLEAWNEIAEGNRALNRLLPDVEALLVNRVGHAHGLAQAEYYIAPIDECYKLVGLIRANWRGLSGGADVWAEIGRFFSELRSKADPVGGEANA